MFKTLFNPRLSEQEKLEAQKHREQIRQDAEIMMRLAGNPDFKRFCELLLEDKEELNKFLLNEDTETMKSNEARTRLIARINQIERTLKKPQSIIWQMKNLTEVREAIQEQTQERKAQMGIK